jgi:hypothetical protein
MNRKVQALQILGRLPQRRRAVLTQEGNMDEIDFLVRPQGTIWTFEPLTKRAKNFTETDLDVADWQWIGTAFGVDHRPAEHLVTALENEGFAVWPG